jgi:H+-transporting ATPase
MDSLAPKAKVKRDGAWKEIDVRSLPLFGPSLRWLMLHLSHLYSLPTSFPETWFRSSTETSAPRITEAIEVSMDQAALTGESLPVGKNLGDEAFSFVLFSLPLPRAHES